MGFVLPVYNAHPYFPLKNLGKKCILYMAKYSICPDLSCRSRSLFPGALGRQRIHVSLSLSLFPFFSKINKYILRWGLKILNNKRR